jgi:type VI secretion system protein ImpK
MSAVRLSDCFTGVMAYVSSLLKSAETSQPPYDEVKEEIRRLLFDSEALVSRGLVPRDDFDQARFAVCAWVDEAILDSRWLQKQRWLSDELQRFYYHTADAGEQFFQRLDGLGPQQREVREVYYLCLALGFSGRYCQPGDEQRLEQIRTANLRLLLGSPAELPCLEREELFPQARPRANPPGGTPQLTNSSRLAALVCLAAPVLLFGILYLVFHLTLSGISENFLRTVNN